MCFFCRHSTSTLQEISDKSEEEEEEEKIYKKEIQRKNQIEMNRKSFFPETKKSEKKIILGRRNGKNSAQQLGTRFVMSMLCYVNAICRMVILTSLRTKKKEDEAQENIKE